LIKEEMKVGPKGQVVISRQYEKLSKQNQVPRLTFTLEDDKAILENLLLTLWQYFEG